MLNKIHDAEDPTTVESTRPGPLPLEDYAALGDGRSVAIVGLDGSIDWWCVPNMNSAPMFDRILSERKGGFFSLTPTEPFRATRAYRPQSNVLETTYETANGRARLVEALNSGSGGRLPWCELARRIEGLEGEVTFELRFVFGTQADTICPFLYSNANATTFHAGPVIGLLRYSDGVSIEREDDLEIGGRVRMAKGQREIVAIVAGQDEPLVVEEPEVIDARIDITDGEWRQWCEGIRFDGSYRPAVIRSALALKLLLYSPTGAIAAAATTSLPEGIGGSKNYDYRFAWVRDASYTIKAFLRIGARAEAKAAFTWLIKRLAEHGPLVCYTLEGELLDEVREIDVPGYRDSRPVLRGNQAAEQHQHGIYGDIFETAARFVAGGNVIDPQSAATLASVADKCAETWRQADSGIWELSELEHYTMSKISAWQALARAVELADAGHIPSTCRDRWERSRDRIAEWVDANCWSERLQSYVMVPGRDELDASLALAVRFGYDGRDRLEKTIRALDDKLRSGIFHYRYHGVENDEGCFLACTFWIIEGLALLGHREEARLRFDEVMEALDAKGPGVLTEMVDPKTGAFLGNMPQGLSHLALIQTAATIDGCPV
ncbi:glycoside hydrolase family 15 protein [Aureimonas sp. ME7]|uniref:glycoside hydrolase family 15 protein n=1 Tax=Aureimonas sp. ME7 TaxID=2744252 RepID=UPI0015F52B1E|nr:glycoside hydrolase family 15 protein [Aureimonas sp. ME7]